jgi:hypothetical protein
LYKKISNNNKPIIIIRDFLGINILGLADNNCVYISKIGGLNIYTVLHELAHTCGNLHHDIKFRIDLVELVSHFIGKKEGMALKKIFTSNKLKMKMPETILEPLEWLDKYNKMIIVRSKSNK